MRTVTEPEFREELRAVLRTHTTAMRCYGRSPAWVTGPGRSGAIAAVYASHILGIPFIPYGNTAPKGEGLIVDTASLTGRTLRKAASKYEARGVQVSTIAVYHQPPRVNFWYEASATSWTNFQQPRSFLRRIAAKFKAMAQGTSRVTIVR